MPIAKRGDAWQVTVCWHGQIHRRSSRHWSRAQAREIEKKLLDELHAGEIGRKPVRTFNAAIERWLKEEVGHKKSSVSLKSQARLIAPILEGRPLSDVADICSEIRAMKATNKGPLAPATINRRLALVRRLLSLAYKRWEWLDEPLHQRVQLLEERNERHVYLTAKEVERLASLCPNAGDAVRLAAYTGIRAGHLLRLTKANVVGDCLHLGIDSKTGRPQLIPLHPDVQAIAAGLPLRVTPSVLRSEFEQARATMKMPHVHFHDLRHTFASWLLQAGADLMHVRDFLGHSTVAVTQRYAHLQTAHLRQALHKIGTKEKPNRAAAGQQKARKAT